MEIQDRIINGAKELFIKNGIKIVTMDFISKELGISKRTIYENFKDKNELIKKILIHWSEQHKSNCYKIVDESQNVIEAIFKIGNLNHETFCNVNPMFYEDLKKFHYNTYNYLNENEYLRDIKLTSKLLKTGVEEGLFNPDINIDVVNKFIHEILTIIHRDDFKVFGRETLYSSVFLPYFNGISTAKGIELINHYNKEFQSN